MTSKYFTYLASNNAPKNKLQVEALRLLQLKSNRLVQDAKAFVSELRSQIGQLNLVHSKCAPLKVSTYGLGETVSIALGEHFTIGFHLYPVKGIENSAVRDPHSALEKEAA